eukprot:scaffold22137_cov127-Isochrysis_galbana.AAC.3
MVASSRLSRPSQGSSSSAQRLLSPALSTRSHTSASPASPTARIVPDTDDDHEEDQYKWGEEPIDTLTGTKLEWSTILEAQGRAKMRKAKECAFCGKSYAGGPDAIRTHLDINIKPRGVVDAFEEAQPHGPRHSGAACAHAHQPTS